MNIFAITLIKIIYKLRYSFKKLERQYDREMIMKTAITYSLPLRVKNQHSKVSKTTSLGKNINFNGMQILGRGNVKIGDNFHSGFGCMILTDNHNYKNSLMIPYDETIISKDVRIGDNVWFGNNVTILPGTILGEGVIVQNGSVVSGHFEDLSIIGGHPAKVFNKRNFEHYYKLKAENKFH